MPRNARSYLPQDERRTQLLELGLRLFGDRSYEDISIEVFAQQANISKGLIYHYFSSKRDFYTEVIRLAAERLAHSIHTSLEQASPQQPHPGLYAYFTFAEQHAGPYRALMHGGLGVDARIQTILEQTRARLADSILHTVARGHSNPSLRFIARAWLGSVEAAALYWMDNRELPVEQAIALLSESLRAQVAAVSDPQA